MNANSTSAVTAAMNFYQGNDPRELAEKYGSPLYVYNESIFRRRCREMMELCRYPNFVVNYAIKANTNLSLLAIAKEEGLRADVSSAGEAFAAMSAGFSAEDLFFIVNNVSADELKYAMERDILVSVDSISELEVFGKLCTTDSRRVALRFNAGVGGGHHEKVVTGGDGTKFGIMPEYIPQVKELLAGYNLKLAGINHHIGSLNWGDLYLEGAKHLFDIARQFDDLEFVDLGGGFAIPYNKQNGEKPLNIKKLGEALTEYLHGFAASYGKQLTFMIEPGRYIAAECGVLLGTVHAVKNSGSYKYAGTDMGFSVLARPTLYDSHHDIEVYRQGGLPPDGETEVISIVGNQCESGDYIAKERELPVLQVGDVLGVLDAGAYGYSMSSQYNHRQRPAEVLIQSDGGVRLIRRRDTFEDMLGNML